MIRLQPLLLLLAVSASAAGREESLSKADASLEAGDYGRAVQQYADLLRLYPEDAVLFNRMGYACLRWGRPADAVPFFRAALRLRPDQAAFWNNLGVCHAAMGQGAEAERCFRTAVGLSESPKYLYNLAVACFRSRKYGEAMGFLRRAWRQDRRYVGGRFDTGRALAEVRRMRERYPEDAELAELERRLLAHLEGN